MDRYPGIPIEGEEILNAHLNTRFQITEILGSGEFATVAREIMRSDGQNEMHVAVKFPRFGIDLTAEINLLREIQQIKSVTNAPYFFPDFPHPLTGQRVYVQELLGASLREFRKVFRRFVDWIIWSELISVLP